MVLVGSLKSQRCRERKQTAGWIGIEKINYLQSCKVEMGIIIEK
jgi:hypothetical protein